MFNYLEFFNEKLESLKKQQEYRVFTRVQRDSQSFPYATINDIENIVVWCSNDYLNMSQHPQVIQATEEAIRTYGVGSGGTRNISGNATSIIQLERLIANWYQQENALLLTSGYVANWTALYALGKLLPNVVFFSDSKNHASMIEGISASRAKKEIFQHNDLEHLTNLLSNYSEDIPKIIAFESIYSMDGDISNIVEISKIAKKFGALTYIDEVHSVGLYGYTGSGLCEEKNILHDIDIIQGNLSKGIGTLGGFITGRNLIIDAIRNFGSGFIFTTSLPPAIANAAYKSIEIIQSDEGRNLRKTQQSIIRMTKDILKHYNIPLISREGHILPIQINGKNTSKIQDNLLTKHNIYVQAIKYPTVPKGQEIIRITPSPYHTEEMAIQLAQSLASEIK